MGNRYLLAQLGPNTGREIMEIHLEDYKRKGYTWFSTTSYRKENKARQYRALLFMVEGEIEYRAEIMEFHSNPNEKQGCPPPDQAPPEYENEENLTWIKLRNLAPEHEITVNQLKITSSGRTIPEVPVLRGCLHYVELE